MEKTPEHYTAEIINFIDRKTIRPFDLATLKASGALFASGSKLYYNHPTSGAIGILFDG